MEMIKIVKVLFCTALLVAGGATEAGEPPLGWNANAEWFMYAPSFAFKEVAGAAKYRFRVLDDCHVTREFVAAKPSDSLAPVWEQLPKGSSRSCVSRSMRTARLSGLRESGRSGRTRRSRRERIRRRKGPTPRR